MRLHVTGENGLIFLNAHTRRAEVDLHADSMLDRFRLGVSDAGCFRQAACLPVYRLQTLVMQVIVQVGAIDLSRQSTAALMASVNVTQQPWQTASSICSIGDANGSQQEASQQGRNASSAGVLEPLHCVSTFHLNCHSPTHTLRVS